MTIQKNVELFMKEFKREVENIQQVEKVEFFGSVLTAKWNIGKSDVDVKVYGNNIPANVKREIGLVFRDLNKKYGLQLENVRCCHPTPFFLDSPQRVQMFQEMMKGHSHIIEIGRPWLKQNAPTYKEIWAMEDSLITVENFLPPIPIPIPKLSEIFDKFR
jgi:predicted nucleotidyltransferase